MCDCNLCKRSRRTQIELDKLTEEQREFWSNVYDFLFETEADLEYYKSLVEGTWPNADEVISNYRKSNVKNSRQS